MSSIISDIFFNSNNNALIDNYLLNQQANQSKSFYKNDKSFNIVESEVSGAKIINHNNSFSNKYDLDHNDNYISLQFVITIRLEKYDASQKIYRPTLKNHNTFKSTNNYLLKVKIGLNYIEQHIQPKYNTLKSQLQLKLPLTEIYIHPAISIQLYESNRSSKAIGICYIPLQNIRLMLAQKQFKRMFNLTIKSGAKVKSSQMNKYKLQCQLEIQTKQSFQQTNLHHKTHSRNKFSNININMQSYDLKKQTKRSSHTGSRGNSKKISSHSNLINYPTHFRRSTYKLSSRNPYQEDRIQETQEKQKLRSFCKSSSNITGNQSDNQILKFQLDNRPTRFLIRQLRYNGIKREEEQKNIGKYKFYLRSTQDIEKNKKFYEINETIVISSSEIDTKGINIAVYQSYFQPQTDGDCGVLIGYFHLNIVLLLGGIVEGIFPVSSDNNNNQCIGVVRLESLQIMCNNKIAPQIDQQVRRIKISEQENKKQRKGLKQGYVIQVVKIYCKTHNFTADYQQNKGCGKSWENNNAQIIIRLSDSSFKVCKNCQIKLHNISESKEYSNVDHILQINVLDPIVIGYQDENYETHESLEIQVYIDYQLIAYNKTILQFKSFSEANHVIFGTFVENFTTGSSISNAVINYARYSIASDYFPSIKLEDSLKRLTNWSILSFILQILSSENKIEDLLTKKILAIDQKIIYIQANRLASLLIKSVTSSNFSYTIVRPISKQIKLINSICNKQKFIQEIKYLDCNDHGVVPFQDFNSILGYYNGNKNICKGWVRRNSGHFTNFEGKSGQVLYLGLLIDYQCETISQKLSLFESQNRLDAPRVQSFAKQQKKHQNQYKIIESQSNQLQFSSQQVHIQAILCSKMNTLMLNDSIPSLRIKLPDRKPEYLGRPIYSCANPIIKLNKKLTNNQTIIFLHYNLKMGKDIEIGKLKWQKGQRMYKLGSQAKIQFLELYQTE